MQKIKYKVSFNFYTVRDPNNNLSMWYLEYLMKAKIRLMRSITSIRNFEIYKEES